MLDFVVAEANKVGVRHRIVVLHCDLGKSPGGHDIDWPGTLELAQEHAQHYGLRFIVVKRKGRGFVEEIQRRGRWPSNGQRYCTSFYKRDPASTIVTQLAREVRAMAKKHGEPFKLRGQARPKKRIPRILHCLGFRAEESPRRRKMVTFAEDGRISNSAKHVDVWLPIHHWTVEQVWARIRQAGTRYHWAYDKGMTRLSCRLCIFAPKPQLMIAARESPELFEEYLDLEKRMLHRFRVDLSLADVKAALRNGEVVEADDGAWNM